LLNKATIRDYTCHMYTDFNHLGLIPSKYQQIHTNKKQKKQYDTIRYCVFNVQ